MITYRSINKKIKVPSIVICDKCGKDFDLQTESGVSEMQEFHQIDFFGGFDSVFGDEIHVEADICQRCLYDMIKGFMRTSTS